MPSPNVQRYTGNPIIPLLAASWYASQIYDFCPVVNPNNTNQLLVYCSGMAAPVQTGIQSIGLFTANVSNPYSLTEHGGAGNGQLITANASGWEAGGGGLRVSAVLNISGTLYMWYTAQDSGGGNKIGLATSTDGTTWTKYSGNPVLVASNDETRALNAGVYWNGTTFYMVYDYYTSTATLPAYRAATSSDGKNWTKVPYKHGTWRDVYSNTGVFNEWQQLIKYGNAYFLVTSDGSPQANTATWTGRLLISGIPTGPYTSLSYNPVLSGTGPAGSSTTPFDKDQVSCLAIFPPPSADPVLYYSGANNNVPTPGNTTYPVDQWPGGAATFVGGIPIDLGNIVNPSVCGRRCPLTIKGNDVSETNTYPVCFGGSGNTEAALIGRLPDDLFLNCQTDGGDICFSSDIGGTNQLAIEVVSINTATKKAEIWVSVPLTAASDVTIYVWYASTAGTLQQPPANYPFGSMSVWWPNSYQLVYHFPSNTTIGDSSPLQYNGTPTGITSATGPLGNGATYGTNNYISAPAINCAFSQGVVSWWANPSVAFNNNATPQIFGWAQSGSTGLPTFSCQKFTDGNFYIGFAISGTDYRISIPSSSSNWVQSTWQKYDYVWNSSGQWLYRNGALLNHSTTIPVAQDIGSNVLIGSQQFTGANNYFSGSQDEFRLGNQAPSANWLATDYVIQSNNVTTSGTPLIVVGTAGPVGGGLALSAQSASWTNPSLALLSSLALGQESASWTDPALTLVNSLALGQESAGWTNPGLAVASALALAAESASWTNPTLNQALALALTGQAAAWSNSALTPSGSGGIVLQLPAQSAVFQVNPLGLFYCPTILFPYMGLEWLVVTPGLTSIPQESCVISQTEVVTLYRKLSDGTFDAGTLVGQALRLDVAKTQPIGRTGAKVTSRLQWYLWANQAGAGVKDGDVIQDAAGVRWVIEKTDVQAWGQRYLVDTVQAK